MRRFFVAYGLVACTVMLLSYSTAYPSSGVDCSGGLGGLNKYKNGTKLGPLDLQSGHNYALKAELDICGTDAPVTDSITVETYSTKRYSLSGALSFASAFGLTGNWQIEEDSVSKATATTTAPANVCVQRYIYQKRPYKQKYTVTALAHGTPVGVPGPVYLYCLPGDAEVATLLDKDPALSMTSSERNSYVPALKTTDDVYNMY